jgi:hypothetical protein
LNKLVGDHYPILPVLASMPIIEYVVQTTRDDPESLIRENGIIPHIEILVEEITSDLLGITKLLHDVASYQEGKSKKTVKKKIYLGYEYEHNNKRYFLTNEILGLVNKKGDKKEKVNVALLNSEIPLKLPSHFFTKEKSSTTFAQLVCILVHTPATDVTLVFAPRIEGENEEVYSGINIVLAQGCTTTIGLLHGDKKGKLTSCIVVHNGVVNK